MSKRIEDLRRYRPDTGWDGHGEMYLDSSGDWIKLRDLPQPKDTRKDPPPNGFYFGQWRCGLVNAGHETLFSWVVDGDWYTINEEGAHRRMDLPDYYCEILCWGHLGKKP